MARSDWRGILGRTLAGPRGVRGVGHRASLPGRGVLTFLVDEAERARAWALWLALVPRLGVEGLEALESAASALATLREELAARLPMNPGVGYGTVDDVALAIAEQHLAPFVDRWTPRLARWRAASHDVNEWPLAPAVEFEYRTIVRPGLVDRAWQLGAFAGLDAGRLRLQLPPAPGSRDGSRDGSLALPAVDAPHPALAGETLAQVDARLARAPDAATRARLWSLVVAGRATLGRLRKPKDDARARDAIAQAVRLADTYTRVLSEAPGGGAEAERALELLEGPLGRFLGRWAGWLDERQGVELDLADDPRRRLKDDVEVLARELESALPRIGDYRR